MNFMFEWQEQYLTSDRSEQVRCYINLLMTVFLMIFRRFPSTSSEDFRKFSKIVPKARRTFLNIFGEFPKISEGVRRFPKIAKDFRGRPGDVSMIHVHQRI